MYTNKYWKEKSPSSILNRLIAAMLFSVLLLPITAAAASLESAAKAFQNGAFAEAYSYYIVLARRGNAHAQRIVGEMYFRGQGVPQSHEAAYQWNLRAAAQGDHLAQFSIGYFYENGLGTQKSLKQAQEYYFLSAKQDYGPAQEKLGDIYRSTGQDNLAEAWYQKAAINNIASAGQKYVELSNISRAAREKSSREYAEEVAREESDDLARVCSPCRGNEYRQCTAKQIPFWTCNQTTPSFGEALKANLAQDRANFENSRRKIDAITAQGLTEPNRQRAEAKPESRRISPEATDRKATPVTTPIQLSAGNISPSTTASSAIEGAEIIESNSYERFPTAELWGDPIPPWMAYKGQGESRASACNSAISLRESKIAEDLARGFVEVKERTECVCQTTPRRNSTIRLQKGWLCVAYWSLTDLRKRRGDSSR